MASATIELRGSRIFASPAFGGLEPQWTGEDALPLFVDWAKRYDSATHEENEAELLALGRAMFAWLDETGWASAWKDGFGERKLEIKVEGRSTELEAALLDAPWELLASRTGPLAADPLQLFVVSRRLGEPGSKWEPRHSDLKVLFMAAAVEGESVLDFEVEETAILKATTRAQRTHLVVDETGALESVAERLTSSEGPFEVVHLSCHGAIDPDLGPTLLLETLEGDKQLVSPGDLVQAFGSAPPPLVVLSACQTAERKAYGSAPPTAPRETGDLSSSLSLSELSAPYARQLATMVPCVVGWDGSVYDQDAIDFAATFYKELSVLRSSVPRAAASARRELLRLRSCDKNRGQHWHLARVFVGGAGGGALCGADKRSRHHSFATPPQAFLDRRRARVPVASREAFVGRRRELQRILRAYRDGSDGVLLYGMGAIGKSSTAARLASRVSMRTCVIFERYDALSIFDELIDFLPPVERQPQRNTWRTLVQQDAGVLEDALEDWLRRHFDEDPILLVIDDLERALHPPKPGEFLTQVKTEFRSSLGAVLSAFSKASTRSKLLLTSRYDFTLPTDRGDAAAPLLRQQLKEMAWEDRIKQLRAAQRISGRETVAGDDSDELLTRALSAAEGNPGLQAALTQPILAGELDAARIALAHVEYYKIHGAPPEQVQALLDSGEAKDSDNALVAFLARISLQTYRDALTPDESLQLAASSLFSENVPIPEAGHAAAGAANGCRDPDRAIRRLVGLGLLDDWGLIREDWNLALNALARPLASLEAALKPQLAQAVVPVLGARWQGPDGGCDDERADELTRLALVAPAADPAILESAALMAAARLERMFGESRKALNVVGLVVRKLSDGYAFDPGLIRIGVECAHLLGEGEMIDHLLRCNLRFDPEDRRSVIAKAQLDLRRSERLFSIGKADEAVAVAEGVIDAFIAVDEERMTAMAYGQLASFFEQRGFLIDALRIRQEKELPVYERLGDIRSRAITLGEIGVTLHRQGKLDEALRIYLEEELPVYHELGDIRSSALAMGRLASIHREKGNLQESLRIRREEEIPVYERLGDTRSRAQAMGEVASILHDMGDLEEAFRIRVEEELPVYERLHEVRLYAISKGAMADILFDQQKYDDALAIRQEELPIYESLNDIHSMAVTYGEIADIFEKQGKIEEGLRLRREKQIPLFEQLDDSRAVAIALGRIADSLEEAGDLEEALRVRLEEEIPAFETCSELRGKAVALGKVSRIRSRLGDKEEAIRILREEQIPLYDQVEDKVSHSIALYNLAAQLLRSGMTDEQFSAEFIPLLQKSYLLAKQANYLVGIATVGFELASFTENFKISDEGRNIFDDAEAAYQLLLPVDRHRLGDTRRIATELVGGAAEPG